MLNLTIPDFSYKTYKTFFDNDRSRNLLAGGITEISTLGIIEGAYLVYAPR